MVVLATTAATHLGLPSASAGSDEERNLLSLIAQERLEEGLPAFHLDPVLTRLARTRSEKMAARARGAHLRATVPAGYTALAENVGAYSSVGSIHVAFMRSPRHRANILGAFDRIGVGVTLSEGGSFYVSELFGRSVPEAPKHREAHVAPASPLDAPVQTLDHLTRLASLFPAAG